MASAGTNIDARTQGVAIPYRGGAIANATDLQGALELAYNAILAADMLVGTAQSNLPASRLATSTATIAWDFSTGGVAKANVPDASITLAKMANMATASVIGRNTAGSGAPEILTIDTTLTTGAGAIGRSAITGHVGIPANSNTATIQSGVITTAMLASAAFSTDGTLSGNSDTAIASQKAVKTYVDALAALVSGALVLKGAWDASTGVFPGGGTAQTGYFYKCTVGGTINGETAYVSDSLYALTNNASTSTYAGNWLLLSGDLTSAQIVAALSANSLAFSKLAQGSALSVLGVTGNATANLASIAATASSGAVLRESGGTLAFGTVATAGIANNAVTNAIIRQGAALSVIGVTGNATANVADIAGTANQALVVNSAGTALAFGAVNLASTAAVTGQLASASMPALTGSVVSSGATLATTSTIDLYVVIGDGQNAIPTGAASRWFTLDFAGTFVQWSLLANASGSVSIDLWKTTYSNFDAGATHPVAADKISASAPMTFSSATKGQSSTLTGWTTTFNAGDVLAFNVASVSTCTQITICLKVTKTS